MTQQFLRNCSLVVADPSGAGIELGALRVVFTVRRGDTQTPNSCDVRIYNLSANTANTIDNEFTQLQLKVSYGSAALQQIFRGSIKQVRKGRENQKNSYVDITAADGDGAYNFSAAALTLAAGTTVTQGIQSIIQAMARQATVGSPTGASGGQPITQGYLPQLSTNPRIRARVYYGPCKDHLRDIAQTNDCKQSIQDGAVTFIPLTSFIPADPILITPFTGLVGVPEQTQNGLTMRVLLNPQIKIGQRVKLDSSDINQFRYGLDRVSIGINKLLAQSTTKLNADGLYYVMVANHSGDTRGVPWYTEMICLAVDASVPATFAPNAAIFPPGDSPRDAIKRY